MSNLSPGEAIGTNVYRADRNRVALQNGKKSPRTIMTPLRASCAPLFFDRREVAKDFIRFNLSDKRDRVALPRAAGATGSGQSCKLHFSLRCASVARIRWPDQPPKRNPT